MLLFVSYVAKFTLPSDVQTDSPKIRKGVLSKVHERKATFEGQRMLRNKSVEDLAKNGFYCVGRNRNRRIVCVDCKFSLSCLDWRDDEDPDVLHLKTYPGCSMLKYEDLDFHFRDVIQRRDTFPADWASRCPISHNDLAEAGFCYAGPRGNEQIDSSDRNKDKVMCYSCKEFKNQWKHGDNPRQEHRSTCGFLFGSRGTRTLVSSGYETASQPEVVTGNQDSPEPSQVWLEYAEGRSETETGIESSCDFL